MIEPSLPFSYTADGIVKDRLGDVIATFKDPQIAFWICMTLNAEEWKEFEDKIDVLERRVESLQLENDDLRSGLDNLRK